MTATETAQLINKPCLLHAGTVEEVRLTVTDVKSAYGVARCLVKNANGKTAWRNLNTLKIVN
jgi:hypothetical protein